jgi:hypothetical protein
MAGAVTASVSDDTRAPMVPGNPRVGDLTCDSATFAWDASTDDEGVTFYDVYHDGQQMTSVSGATLSTSLTVVAGQSDRHPRSICPDPASSGAPPGGRP